MKHQKQSPTKCDWALGAAVVLTSCSNWLMILFRNSSFIWRFSSSIFFNQALPMAWMWFFCFPSTVFRLHYDWQFGSKKLNDYDWWNRLEMTQIFCVVNERQYWQIWQLNSFTCVKSASNPIETRKRWVHSIWSAFHFLSVFMSKFLSISNMDRFNQSNWHSNKLGTNRQLNLIEMPIKSWKVIKTKK